MSKPKLISPLLDHFAMGEPISDRSGIRTCPAMEEQTGERYMVKIISTPANPSQLDALLLTGAYADRVQALAYYKGVAEDILRETEILEKLSAMEGFVCYDGTQISEADDQSGYDVYLRSPYRKSLERHMSKHSLTHLSALNLGLDLCSALAICRRFGYLYVALKPENIYMMGDKGFKIGDIGFISFDSLKYASLPDRYRSAYTAPEVADAFASISTTMDVYAVGLVLYQVFNGGLLPDAEEGPLPAPEFADYEMAEIILKACAANPEDRWQDPAQMGQALVGYMQRNGAHDTPIVPAPVAVAEEPAEAEADTETSEQEAAADVQQTLDIPEVTEDAVKEEPIDLSDPEDTPLDDSAAEAVSHSEDDYDNMSFLSDSDDETLPGEDSNDADNAQISVEVLDMLNQADELIAHKTPDPVIPPEPIDVQIPSAPAEDVQTEEIAESAQEDTEAPVAEDAEESTEPIEDIQTEDETSEEAEPEQQDAEAEPEADEDENDEYDYDEDYDTPKPKSHWVRNTLLVLLALLILAGGFVFYKFYYLQHIDSLTLAAEDFSLTVFVKTETDESLLNVVCYDTYGNQLQSPVVDGKAIFDELTPDCAYTIKVAISGFHSLTGEIAVSYATPKQTAITQFNAVTGAEDGSAILNFTVDGPDPGNWIIRYSAPDEQTQEVTCAEHMYTFTGLTLDKEYTFELVPSEDKRVVGTTKITHVASKTVSAENLAVTNCANGKLTVAWQAPEGVQITGWTVHCFNEKGYDQTLTTDQMTATFENIVTNDPYTVEVTAQGMSISQQTYVQENAVTVTDFAVSKTDDKSLTLTWKNGNNTPANGWILRFSVDGSAVKEVKSESADTVTVSPYIPDSQYSFTLLTADSVDVVGGKLFYTTQKSEDFNSFGIKKSNMVFSMCRTPSVSNWDKSDLASSDYTTSFKSNQKASFLVRMLKSYSTSGDKVLVTYVIRNSDGDIVNFSTQETKWKNMWYRSYGEFNLPALPTTAGKYQVSVYFNGALAGEEDFRIK